MEQIETNVALALLANVVLQGLKKTKFVSFITDESKALNRFLGGVFALCSSLGISFANQGNWLDGMTVTITTPQLSIMIQNALVIWGIQESFYRKVLKRTKYADGEQPGNSKQFGLSETGGTD